MDEIRTLGQRLAEFREREDMSQAELADKIGVPVMEVTLWERDELAPDLDILIKTVQAVRALSTDDLAKDMRRYYYPFPTMLSSEKLIAAELKEKVTAEGLTNTIKALDYIQEVHEGQKLFDKNISYIYHPLTMACHCLALNITDDVMIATCLLKGAIEDHHRTYDELPVDEETKALLRLVVREKFDRNDDKAVLAYFNRVASNPKAALIKCIDRCNKLSSMYRQREKEETEYYEKETRRYIVLLLMLLKDIPEYKKAAWLIKYQIESCLDRYIPIGWKNIF